MPADVDRYVKEMQEEDPSMPDDKAWAIAWSRYCKYKNPGSSHCKQDEYFTGQGKSGSYSFRMATKNLPAVLKTVLKSLRIQIPREISIYTRVMDDLYSAGNDGCKGFAVVVNLRSKLTDEYWGDFGGGGFGKVLLVDDLNQPKFPLNNETVILKGERGSTSSVFLCCNPDVAEVFRGRGLEKMSSLTYSKFKDAAEIDPRYGSGRTQIWYCQRKFFRELSVGSSLALKRGLLPDPFDLEKTHVYIGNVNETSPNKVFYMMQGEVWSPEGEARGLMSVQSCGHTSMSVGDVMVINGEAFMVDMNGFFDLMKAQPRTASASRVAAQKAKKDVAKGKLAPPNKFPAAKGLKDMSGGGKHHTRTKDVAKGQSRKEKHKKSPVDKEASLTGPLRLQRDYGSTEFGEE